MAPPEIVIADTCSAYKLYFFTSNGIIPNKNIVIPNFGKILFHKIVIQEFYEDLKSFESFKSVNLKLSTYPYPSFFNIIKDEGLKDVKDFIQNNLYPESNTDIRSQQFQKKKKIFDDYRESIQADWRDKGRFQGSKKSKSKPSDEDYILLFHAEKGEIHLLTNDEILFDVSSHFLENKSKKVFMAEHAIRAAYKNNNSLKPKISDSIKNLSYLGELFKEDIVFN